MLPAPVLPLAEHAECGQNCFDASIGSVVLFCISTSCQGPSLFSILPQFHRLEGSYRKHSFGEKKGSIVLENLQNLWVKRQFSSHRLRAVAEAYGSRTHQGPRRATPQPF